MTRQQLIAQIEKKQSLLCVGLDTDVNRIPPHLLTADLPQFEFNKAIVDATAQYAIAYKPNLAFYESQGITGWQSLIQTVKYIRTHYPDVFVIADAKRGDIGNTSTQYAKTFFETIEFDAVTLSPYMGQDVVNPFLTYREKWIILLALTSNASADAIQQFTDTEGTPLYEHVLEVSKHWGSEDNTMYVVGATKAEWLEHIRKIVPQHFLLVPGIGAQGGRLEDVIRYGKNSDYGLIINSSRGIIFSNEHPQYDKAAEIAAKKLQEEMKALLF